MHNQKAGAFLFVERDIPVALVGYFDGEQLPVEIVEFDVHLHVKINKHIAEFKSM
jgi:hypothetical protein